MKIFHTSSSYGLSAEALAEAEQNRQIDHESGVQKRAPVALTVDIAKTLPSRQE